MKISFHLPQLTLRAEHIVGPIVVFLLAILCFVNSEQWSTSANFDRAAILSGEYWRILSGHFFHTNTAHLLLNLSGLTMLWLLHGHYYRVKSYIALIVVLCLSTSMLIFMYSPELERYVGLSGILHGVFVYGSVRDILSGEKTGYILLLGLTLKVLHEQLVGPSADISALINANVAIDAHMWGALSGGFYSIFYKLSNKQQSVAH